MGILFSYVGDLDDPDFHWERPGDATGSNLPRRITPQDRWAHFDALRVGLDWVLRMIAEGRYDGRQLDWGAWGLKMTGRELQALLTDPEDAELLAELDPATSYVLVVAEDV